MVKTPELTITVLGCGGSLGVPLVGGHWGACDPLEPRNRRRRASILISSDEANVLVDTTPDCRDQLLDAGVTRLDGVIYTHGHADHVHGIDDLRPLIAGEPLDAWTDAPTIEILEQRFAYATASVAMDRGLYHPLLTPRLADAPFVIGDIRIDPFVQDHGYSQSLGLRVGAFAYSTDVVNLDDEAFRILDGVDTWIVDACREEPHPSHAHLDRTLSWIERVRPRRAYLTHMNQTMDYRSLMERLPDGVEPAYDGLRISVPAA